MATNAFGRDKRAAKMMFSASSMLMLLILTFCFLDMAAGFGMSTDMHFDDATDEHNPCVEYPCGPVGSCRADKREADGYSCKCDEGFDRPNNRGPCVDIDECQSENPCAPGTCTNKLGFYECACPEGYVETTTDGKASCIADAKACSGKPCGPAGRCVPLQDGTFRCNCVPGFAVAEGSAAPCLEIFDPCTGNPCGNGGECTRVLGGGYHCSCYPGYYLPAMYTFGGRCIQQGQRR